MTTTELLLGLVTSLLSRVPLLIAVVLGLVLLWRAPAGPLRRAGLAGMWLSLGCVLAEVALQAIPMLLLQQGDVRRIAMLMGVGSFVLTTVQAVGIGLLGWTLARSLQRLPTDVGSRG